MESIPKKCSNRKAAMPLSFSRSYPDVDFKVVTRDNFGTFLL